MRDGQPRQAQLYMLHRTGHRVPVHVRSVPLRNSFGDIIGAAEIFEERSFEPEIDSRQNRLAQYRCMDPTTELPNHGLMASYLREQLHLFAEHRLPFSIMLVEPDQLEQFVSTHGREAERSVLQVLAHTLRRSVRPTDFLGRWNDTQFLIILCGCREDALPAMAHRLQTVVKGSCIQWWGDRLTVTVNIAGSGAKLDDTVESILMRVESLLAHTSKHKDNKAVGGGA